MANPDRGIDPRILEAAREDFLSKPYDMVSLREICSKAGVTTGAFYNRYKNKEELFDALVMPTLALVEEYSNQTETASYTRLNEENLRRIWEMTSENQSRIIDMFYDNYDGCKFSESSVPAPVVGAIPCGTPEEEEENIQEYVSLPVSLFGKGEFYILKASGDSMEDAGIEDGDMVVIRKQPEAHVGDIVVALDETGSNTLKKYGGIDPDSHSVILLYQNQKKYPDKRILVKELTVQGIAQHVIKTL